jgi:hypothetical protein
VRLQPLGHLSRDHSAAAWEASAGGSQSTTEDAAIKSSLILRSGHLKPQGEDVELVGKIAGPIRIVILEAAEPSRSEGSRRRIYVFACASQCSGA